MTWVFFAVLSAFLLSIVYHIDKLILSKLIKDKSIGVVFIFSSLVGMPVALITYLIFPHVLEVSLSNVVLLMVSGILYILSTLPYFYALKDDEASIVAPLYQTVSIFSLLMELVLLKVLPTSIQFLGMLLVIFSTFILTYHVEEVDLRVIRLRTVKLTLLSAFIFALNSVLFKHFSFEVNFESVVFWENVSLGLIGISSLVLFKHFRADIKPLLNLNSKNLIALNLFNEIINICSKLAFNYATLFIPVAVVLSTSDGSVPFMVLFLGLTLKYFFPKLIEESSSKKYITVKIFAMTIGFMGLMLLTA